MNKVSWHSSIKSIENTPLSSKNTEIMDILNDPAELFLSSLCDEYWVEIREKIKVSKESIEINWIKWSRKNVFEEEKKEKGIWGFDWDSHFTRDSIDRIIKEKYSNYTLPSTSDWNNSVDFMPWVDRPEKTKNFIKLLKIEPNIKIDPYQGVNIYTRGRSSYFRVLEEGYFCVFNFPWIQYTGTDEKYDKYFLCVRLIQKNKRGK